VELVLAIFGYTVLDKQKKKAGKGKGIVPTKKGYIYKYISKYIDPAYMYILQKSAKRRLSYITKRSRGGRPL